ncbi:hypothetical protein DRQ20_00140 [bacterium]|nr:MAG: hypothetical protein DRQ20_00140 [bacterium]
MRKVVLGLLLCAFVVSAVSSRPVDDVVPLKVKPTNALKAPAAPTQGAEIWWEYVGSNPLYIYGGTEATDTFCIWVEPPAACSLKAMAFWIYVDSGVAVPSSIFVFAADPADTIDFWNDYVDYHEDWVTGPEYGGPSPLETFLHTEYRDVPITLDSAVMYWDTVYLSTPVDMDTNIFVIGWAIPTLDGGADTLIHPIIHAHEDPPLDKRSLVWQPADPDFPGFPGWYHNWHLYKMKALIKLYKNPAPFIEEVTRWTDTYLTTGRTVNVYAWDIGVTSSGIDSSGVAEAYLYYQINGGDTLYTPLVEDSSMFDSYNFYHGWFHGSLPDANPGDTVFYWVRTIDPQGKMSEGGWCTYVVRAGTPGNYLLVVNDYYGSDWGLPDPLTTLFPNYDLWDVGNYIEGAYGYPDSSVIEFYTSGDGLPVIVWLTWDGLAFGANEENIKRFLDNGGCLWLAGQDFTYGMGISPDWGDWTVSAGDFAYDYLQLRSGTDDFAHDTAVAQWGVPGDIITDGMNPIYVAPYAWYTPMSYCWMGKFDSVSVNATPDFYYITGEIGGFWYEDATAGYKLVIQYWPWYNMCESEENYNVWDVTNMDSLTVRVFRFFGYSPGGVPGTVSEKVSLSVPAVAGKTADITFSVPADMKVSLKIFDVTGRCVKVLYDGNVKKGIHTLKVNTEELPTGAYFVRLDTGKRSATEKLIVVH